MIDPYTNVQTSGSHQTGAHLYDSLDSRRLASLISERMILVAQVTAIVEDEQYTADVYIGTTGLSISGGTKIYTALTVFNPDPNKTYAVNDIVQVNILAHGIGLIAVQGSGGDPDVGQYQGQSKMMETQNQVGWTYLFAHELL